MAVPVRPINSQHCLSSKAKDSVHLINIQGGGHIHAYLSTKEKGKGKVAAIHAMKACGGRYSSSHS
jgi:hypothetical protein